MHYRLWRNNTETFKDYWLHGNTLGKIQDRKIILNEEFLTNTMNVFSL
jgi:hypothetical protein